MKGKPVSKKEWILLVILLAVAVWVLLNYGVNKQVVLAQEPPPPWWNPYGYAPASMDDPAIHNPGSYISPYGVVIRYNAHRAREFANELARRYSQGYEIVTSGKIGPRHAVFMSGVMDWNYAAGMALSMNGFAAAAGPPRHVLECALDPCCLNPRACETVYQ